MRIKALPNANKRCRSVRLDIHVVCVSILCGCIFSHVPLRLLVLRLFSVASLPVQRSVRSLWKRRLIVTVRLVCSFFDLFSMCRWQQRCARFHPLVLFIASHSNAFSKSFSEATEVRNVRSTRRTTHQLLRCRAECRRTLRTHLRPDSTGTTIARIAPAFDC